MRISRSRLTLAAALGCCALVATSIPAAAGVAAAGPGGFAAGFLTPVVVIAEGEGITFVNGDAAPHDFVADGVFLPPKAAGKARWCSSFSKKRCPLFWSARATAGESVEVEGLERVGAGKQYPFYCSLHPNMKGTLVVR
ncbi:MAG TPA: plastocyanin/azurin family copper-binding protein [Actinomycetota bacterium]|nr:plastocyanin/azurin family copper-binding protein [Actinomycetota bacterium]